MSSPALRPRRGLRVPFVVGMLGALVLLTRLTTVHAAPPKSVRLERGSVDAVDPELWMTLDPLLSHIGLRMVEEASDADTVAHVVLSSDARGVRIVVFDPRRSGAPIRRQVARGDSPALFRETVAQVVLSMVEPMSETPPQPEPAPTVTPALPALVAEPVRVDDPGEAAESKPGPASYVVGARSGLAFVGTATARPGFGAHLAVRFGDLWASPVLMAEGLFVLPHEVKDARTSSSFRASQLRVIGALTVWQRGRSALELGLGPGLDVVSFETRRAPPDLTPSPLSRRVQPIAALRAQLRVGLSTWLALLCGAGLDLDLAPRRWAVEREREQDLVFETGRVRPQFFAALDFRMAGPSLLELGGAR